MIKRRGELLIIGLILFLFLLFGIIAISTIPEEKMKACKTDQDCVPVKCECGCSGCGGFDYDGIVNKKYRAIWHVKEWCSPEKTCPDVCCTPKEAICENSTCTVIFLTQEELLNRSIENE
jgi:hypothetical protein